MDCSYSLMVAIKVAPLVLVLAAPVALSACNSGSRDKTSGQLPGDDVVRVRVEGTPVTQYDVQRAIETSLTKNADVGPETEAKVLESLVTSRAIALKREKELDDVGRAELERAVARYREQLLVEQYIAEHHPPTPVSGDSIRAYYNEHAESFGARAVRTFELLTVSLADAPGDQQKALTKLTDAAQKADWKAATAGAAAKQGIEYQTGTASDEVLHPRLRHALRTLNPGQVSAPIVVQTRAYVLRVTGETKTEPRPLSEVSESIRTSLAARALQDSIAKAAKDVRAQVKIEYVEPK